MIRVSRVFTYHQITFTGIEFSGNLLHSVEVEHGWVAADCAAGWYMLTLGQLPDLARLWHYSTDQTVGLVDTYQLNTCSAKPGLTGFWLYRLLSRCG